MAVSDPRWVLGTELWLSARTKTALNPLSNLSFLKINKSTVKWWHTPSIVALRKQEHEDLCEFKTSPVYILSSRTDTERTMQRPCLNK